MSDATDKNPRRSSSGRGPKSTGKSSGDRRGAGPKSSTDLGKALRTVYDSTLGERVPDDFLDLLGKLS
ncbi:MAG: NepR family anti-sigma factor [Sphingomicrobium sp.]